MGDSSMAFVEAGVPTVTELLRDEKYVFTPFGVVLRDDLAEDSFNACDFWDKILTPAEQAAYANNKDWYLAGTREDTPAVKKIAASSIRGYVLPWSKPVFSSVRAAKIAALLQHSRAASRHPVLQTLSRAMDNGLGMFDEEFALTTAPTKDSDAFALEKRNAREAARTKVSDAYRDQLQYLLAGALKAAGKDFSVRPDGEWTRSQNMTLSWTVDLGGKSTVVHPNHRLRLILESPSGKPVPLDAIAKFKKAWDDNGVGFGSDLPKQISGTQFKGLNLYAPSEVTYDMLHPDTSTGELF